MDTRIDILVHVSNYKSRQIPFLYNVMKNFETWPAKIDFVLNSTDNLLLDQKNWFNFTPWKFNTIKQNIYPETLGYGLSMKHRDQMIEKQDDYDLFIYCEDDIIIPWGVVTLYLNMIQNIPENHIIGFLRYENDDRGNKYIVDHNTPNPVLQKNIIINNKLYFQLRNLHQGCFVLTKHQLKRCISTKYFEGFKTFEDIKPRAGYDANASSSTDVFTCGAFQKIYPHNNFKNLLIHHSTNKFFIVSEKENRLRVMPLKKFEELIK